MSVVRFGVAGLGNMGTQHVQTFPHYKNAVLAAGCDGSAALLDKLPEGVARFSDYDEMINSGKIDAVVIAVPHFAHVPMSIKAIEKGIHVLCEKPIAVSVKAAREINAVATKNPNVAFGVVLQQRTNPLYVKLRELIQDGELGAITRITWIVTDWFRPHAYYGSGGWRATWKGEGGGVLINQCPHNLDLLQWVTGMMPSRVTAVGFVGKTHPIEVEDEISAVLEYSNGAIGHFIASTGEAPGTNRLEIVGDRGKIVAEGGEIRFTRTRKSVDEVNRTSVESFPTIETWDIRIPVSGGLAGGLAVLGQNFIDHIRDNTVPLLSPGTDGVKGLEIGNAMVMAGLTRQPVELPVDGDRFDAFLADMAKQYGGRKTVETRAVTVDMGSSFGT